MEPVKTGPLLRDMAAAEFRLAKSEQGTDIEFSASSETPVERGFGTEILIHEADAIRMQRIDSKSAPLLFNHDWNDPIGMVDEARIKDRRLQVRAHLFKTDRANEVRTMIEGGLRNISIGYQLHEIQESKGTYRATDWEPLEFSIVTVPADSSIGIGRSVDMRAVEVRVVSDQSDTAEPAINLRTHKMEVVENVQAGGSAEQLSAVEAEKQRRQAIIDLCGANKIDSRVQDNWIRSGTPLTTIARELVDVMAERSKDMPAAGHIGMSKKEAGQYSLFRAIRAMRYGSQDRRYQEEAGFEIECSKALAQKMGRSLTSSILVPAEVLSRPMPAEAMTRAMATTPGAKGGYLVNVENMGFIEILRNRSVAMNMGARVLSGLNGNVVFPRQTGKVAVTWQAGEGASITAADQALGQLSMTPKTCIAITDVSEQLLAQASISAEAFVMADLARDVAIDGVDNAVINGVGGAQPLGIKNTPGVTTGQDAATATYAKILAFVSTAAGVNAIRGNPGFVTNAAGAAKLLTVQRFSSTDTPVWEGNIMDGQLVGFKAMSSEQLPSGNLIFGSWDEVVIGEWGVLELATDTGGTRFNSAQVGIRAMWMVDVMIRYPQAFVVSVSLS